LDPSTNKLFNQEPASVIEPAMPFYYQAAEDGNLSFSGSSLSFTKAPSRTRQQNIQTQWIQLFYGNPDAVEDQTNIYLHPDKFDTSYETGYDVSKMSKEGSKPFVYTSVECGDLAFTALPDSIAAQQRIPLTVYAPQADEMYFTLALNDFMQRLDALWLYDNETGMRTNLLYDDYVYYAEQGAEQGRFYLQPVFRKPSVATDIELTDREELSITTEGSTIKVVNAKSAVRCYDVVGHLIGEYKQSEHISIDVPAAGVYFIQANNEILKLVIK
jgi:hypothetical protein